MPQPLAVTAFMASPGRFELPAPRLGGVCSIQLSYGDIFNLLWSRMEQLASQDFDDLIIRRGLLYPFNYGGRCTGAAAEPPCILYPIPPILSMRHKNFSGFCGVFSPSAVAICVFSGYNKKLCFERMWKCPHRADALRGPHFDLDRAK